MTLWYYSKTAWAAPIYNMCSRSLHVATIPNPCNSTYSYIKLYHRSVMSHVSDKQWMQASLLVHSGKLCLGSHFLPFWFLRLGHNHFKCLSYGNARSSRRLSVNHQTIGISLVNRKLPLSQTTNNDHATPQSYFCLQIHCLRHKTSHTIAPDY